MAGARTAALGRILSTFGWIWILGAIVTAFVGGGRGVPFLPGIIIFLLGRTMSALGKRGASEDDETGVTAQPGPSTEPAAREPRREERPVSQRNENLEQRRRREPPATEPEEGFEIPDLEEAILEAPPPMTSDEMIAEARRSFAPRPSEEGD